MSNETYLAREYEVEINTGTEAVPVWTVLRGWTSCDVSPETESTDDSHAHSGGWKQGKVTQRGLSLSMSFNSLRNAAGQRDPGQQALLDLAEAVGTGSLGEFRRYHKGTGEGHEFSASVEAAWPSGGYNDNAAFEATLTVDGEPAEVTVATSNLPVVSGLSDTSGPAAGGEVVIVEGQNFTGATAVTFGGTAATDFHVLSGTQIAAVAPAHAAGVVQVQVTTAAGVSADTAADNYTYA